MGTLRRSDAHELQNRLDDELTERKARLQGICPIRRRVFDNAFDDAVQQLKGTNKELGTILSSILDEHRMTIDAHQIVLNSSFTYGLEKQESAQQCQNQYVDEIKRLQEENEELEEQLSKMEMELKILNRNGSEINERRNRSHKKEMDFLESQSEHLLSMIEKFS